MKESIPFYVLRFLDQIPELHLPGLGSFYRVETPARIDLEEGTAFPPARHSRFIYDEKADASLFEGFLEYQTGKSGKYCSQEIRSFVNDLLLRLKKEGKVSIRHFGTFQFDAPAGVRFVPDPASENARYLGFRPVSLHLGPASEPGKDDSVATPETHQNDQVDIAPVPVEIGQGDAGTTGTGGEEPHVADDPALPIAEEISKTHPAPDVNDGESGLAAVSEKEEKPMVWPWYYGSILLLLLVMALLFLYDEVPAPFFTGHESAGKVVDPSQEIILEGRVDSQLSHGTVEGRTGAGSETVGENAPLGAGEKPSGPEKESPPAEENGTAPGEVEDPFAEADCMVVVGAFREQANVTSMHSRLDRMGYRPYLKKKGSLTLVGVKRPCRTAELRSVLYEVRNEIEGGSWVLRISGTPPPD